MDINRSVLGKLYIGFSAIFQEALDTAPSQYDKIAMTVPSATRINDYSWLGTLPTMEEWVGDRVIRNLKAHDYSIKNKAFESTVAVKAEDIEDDQYGIYAPIFKALGMQAKTHPDRLIFGQLKEGHETPCYDGKSFFATNHPVGKKTTSNLLGNDSAEPWYLMCTTSPVKPMIFQKRREYRLTRKDAPDDDNVFMRREFVYGVDCRVNVGFGLWQCAVRSTDPLDADSYARARALMMTFKNDSGVPLGLVPDLLLVPPTHEAAARMVVSNTLIGGGNTNPWYNTAELLVSPWLA